jgi:hypothetical protein
MVADVVDALVASGAILKSKIRNELMDVRPMLSPNFKDDPLLRIERGAMIKFGACTGCPLLGRVVVCVCVSLCGFGGCGCVFDDSGSPFHCR